MNELLRSLNRVRELLLGGQYEGADHVLETAMENAKSSTAFINAQNQSMASLHLKVKELTADVAVYKELMEYWEKRARASEPDDTLDTLRAHGLEDHLTGSEQDA